MRARYRKVTSGRSLVLRPDAADRLGYAEPASSTHAFRRWTGPSPREHRRPAGP
ncbi:hypothetical protein JOD57_002012 [Geodermatophilus bullaregiensis]|uniref:helix-turn-helix transcriptional regulator n=1 Tax=Geodermatophilus bullaregiensis TaxID=1564160 RepID=UPI00195CD359|nr:helix-turn-helix transcriptional regulator [Geodermatophilus bullaregiensis]MBM7806175.1 hypothetical protein [Geodermatophilus bullaregiensis]